MRKAKSSKFRFPWSILPIAGFALLYLGLCFVVYFDAFYRSGFRATFITEKVLPSTAVSLHSSAFYKEVAGQMLYAPHDPDQLDRFFKAAILKNPSDSEAFLSYGKYLHARNCCTDQIALLLNESILRSPSTPKIRYEAASLLLELGER